MNGVLVHRRVWFPAVVLLVVWLLFLLCLARECSGKRGWIAPQQGVVLTYIDARIQPLPVLPRPADSLSESPPPQDGLGTESYLDRTDRIDGVLWDDPWLFARICRTV